MQRSAVEALHDELSLVLDDALSDQDRESANGRFAAAEHLAQQILANTPDDADACYAIALTWYHRWLPREDRRRCLPWLRKTIELCPQHPWARLYLGYQLFDDDQYGGAFAEFEQVDREFFASIEHHWRNIKTQELMLCCQIRGQFPTVPISALTELVSAYLQAEVFDRPIPLEIVSTLATSKHRQRFNVEPRETASEMCRLIEGIGDEKVFAKELATFHATAAESQ